uniref:Uncharacterized protein n=1 Tax=Nomascus leucogenys TaxID=61853 RepID=A0A2I3GEF6_NOMLE
HREAQVTTGATIDVVSSPGSATNLLCNLELHNSLSGPQFPLCKMRVEVGIGFRGDYWHMIPRTPVPFEWRERERKRENECGCIDSVPRSLPEFRVVMLSSDSQR